MMFEKTQQETIVENAHVWAIPRTPHQISNSEDGCPFFYLIKCGHNEPYQQGAIKLYEQDVTIHMPAGIPLLEKAIETLKEQIDEEQRESAKKIAEMQARIDSLALIEYIPTYEMEGESPVGNESQYEEPSEEVDPAELEPDEDDFNDSMDGDHDSAMASAGHGTDEDYGGGTEQL